MDLQDLPDRELITLVIDDPVGLGDDLPRPVDQDGVIGFNLGGSPQLGMEGPPANISTVVAHGRRDHLADDLTRLNERERAALIV